jgi:hypothetical protein
MLQIDGTLTSIAWLNCNTRDPIYRAVDSVLFSGIGPKHDFSSQFPPTCLKKTRHVCL